MYKKDLFINFFSYIFLFLSFLIFSYILYKIIVDNSYDYLKLYFFSSFVLFIFYLSNIFFKNVIKIYTIIISLTIGISLYSFQAYIILNKLSSGLDKKKIKEYEKISNSKFDTRSKLEIYNELKENEQITVSITPYNLRKDNNLKLIPLSGISKIRTILCNESGYYSIYKSDKFGFNNPDIEWNKEEAFAVLVGNSFVHGSCVNPPNDIGGVLRSKVKNKSIINLGQAGNAPLTQYATLREYLKEIKTVERVVWFHYEANDLNYDFREELSNKILNNYLQNLEYSQKLSERQNEINIFLNSKIEKILNDEVERKNIEKKNLITNFIKLNDLRYLIFKKSKYENNKPNLLEFEQIIKLTKKIVEQKNAKFYFVYLPSYSYTDQKFTDLNYQKVKDIINNLEIPFIDINQLVLKKEKDPKSLFPFRIWNHFSIDGYLKVGNAVFEAIK